MKYTIEQEKSLQNISTQEALKTLIQLQINPLCFAELKDNITGYKGSQENDWTCHKQVSGGTRRTGCIKSNTELGF